MMHTGWKSRQRALAWSALFSIAAYGQETVDVRIESYRFTPAEISIRAGDSVRWTNHEKRTSHSVILPGVPESERMFPDENWTYRFDKAGRYEYRCGPHPEMIGVILVGD